MTDGRTYSFGRLGEPREEIIELPAAPIGVQLNAEMQRVMQMAHDTLQYQALLGMYDTSPERSIFNNVAPLRRIVEHRLAHDAVADWRPAGEAIEVSAQHMLSVRDPITPSGTVPHRLNRVSPDELVDCCYRWAGPTATGRPQMYCHVRDRQHVGYGEFRVFPNPSPDWMLIAQVCETGPAPPPEALTYQRLAEIARGLGLVPEHILLSPEAIERTRQAAHAGDYAAYRLIAAPLRAGTGPANNPTPEATERAKALLLSYLTPAQQRSYDASRKIWHEGKRYSYEIGPGTTFNVDYFEPGGGPPRFLGKLCCIPAGAEAMPVEDVMLAQLLALRTDEDGFLARANRSPGRLVARDVYRYASSLRQDLTT
jgi:hypothetical protein